jgi:hypothetical protein
VTSSPVDLAGLFAVAQEAVVSHQQEINDLDGYNGNHGDNVAHTMQMIVETLHQNQDKPPAAALEQAGRRLRTEGRGGTSQHYAQRLRQSAEQLTGRPDVNAEDALVMVQTLLRAIPNRGHPQDAQAGGSVLDQVLGTSQGQPVRQEQTGGPLGGPFRSLVPAGLALFRAEMKRRLREQAEEEKADEARTYVVKSGDSLSKIARELLGEAGRWPELAPDGAWPGVRLTPLIICSEAGCRAIA